jgi:hypothetical protein
MIHIISMVFLGIIGGFVACLWTRITKKNMIFHRLGRWMEIQNNKHLIDYTTDSVWIFLLRCSFCFSVWITLALMFFYAIKYDPPFMIGVIGTFGALGAGNFICEIVNALRNEG